MSEIEYEVREKDLIAFNEHLLQNSERIQKTMRRHQAIVPGSIAVIGLMLFFYFKDIPSAIYVILISAGWGMGVPMFLKWSMRKQLRQMYSEEEKASLLGRYTLRADKDALVEIAANGESKLSWKKVLRIEVEKKHIFIFITLDTALIIPRDAIISGSLHEFVKEADERIEQAG